RRVCRLRELLEFPGGLGRGAHGYTGHEGGDAREGSLVGGGAYGAVCGAGDEYGRVVEWGGGGEEDRRGVWAGGEQRRL
ncbi:hypothetical protein LTR04_004724, partial [Oleoguttula sp. CCFEE 6159]